MVMLFNPTVTKQTLWCTQMIVHAPSLHTYTSPLKTSAHPSFPAMAMLFRPTLRKQKHWTTDNWPLCLLILSPLNFSVIPVNTSENKYIAVKSQLRCIQQCATNSATQIFLWSLRKSHTASTAEQKHFAQNNVLAKQFLAEYSTMSISGVFQSQVPSHMYQLQSVYLPE